jgi:16S rRNA (cytosine967-C5)-methyltransferase
VSASSAGDRRRRRPSGAQGGRPSAPPAGPGVTARRLAAEGLERIAGGGAYANLVVPALLERSDLEGRDRAFVTDLVYGTTRMQRACDWLVDRYLPDPERVDVTARSWLRLGAFQLAVLGTPAHAAVGATVEAAPKRLKGLLNAVLRKVATGLPVTWPDDATRLSQPDWIVRRLSDDLGHADALAALEAMNEPAEVTVRADGYVQDRASQWVADAVGAQPGERVADLCAAPGGKATALAQHGATVVALDLHTARAGLVAGNAARLGLAERVEVVTADATRAPLRSGAFDKVLLDAPCSGLGALRRRPDARWRIRPDDVGELAALQLRLVDAALALLRPGGELTYSVCTLTRAESEAIDAHLGAAHPEVVALERPDAPWRPFGRGALLLPQDAGTDGMYVLRLRTPSR